MSSYTELDIEDLHGRTRVYSSRTKTWDITDREIIIRDLAAPSRKTTHYRLENLISYTTKEREAYEG